MALLRQQGGYALDEFPRDRGQFGFGLAKVARDSLNPIFCDVTKNHHIVRRNAQEANGGTQICLKIGVVAHAASRLTAAQSIVLSRFSLPAHL